MTQSFLARENIKRLLAFAALNIFGFFLIYLLHDFITPFLGAVIFYILFSKLMTYLTETRKWNAPLSAVLIIFISFVIVLIPIMGLSYLLYAKIAEVVTNPSSIMHTIEELDQKIFQLTGMEVLSDENIKSIIGNTGNMIPSFLNQLVWVLGNIGVMYFILYYMLIQRDKMNIEIDNYLPFNEENKKILATELQSQTLSNSIGVPLIALIQGSAAGLGYWMFGMSEPVFWGIVTAFASILPLVGSTLIWAPAALILMVTGDLWQGVFLAIYGAVVIINIDNIARFMIQKKFADVHPIITVFGVIIGLDLFGLPGLIFGPLMLSYFVIFVTMYRKVYHIELKDKKETD